MLREILNNKKLKLKPVGFIDDDKKKVGKKLQGYPFLGTLDGYQLKAGHFCPFLLYGNSTIKQNQVVANWLNLQAVPPYVGSPLDDMEHLYSKYDIDVMLVSFIKNKET